MNEFCASGAAEAPYEVEGQERADRFAHNFEAQELLGASGVLEQTAIFREAQLGLSENHFVYFCSRIGSPPGSVGFTKMRLIDERYRKLRSLFDTRLASTAVLHLIVSRTEVFEKIVQLGRRQLYMDASEIRQTISESML